MKRLSLVLALLFCGLSNAANFHFNFNLGQDNPDDGEEREGAATLIGFGLTSGKKIFRLRSSFVYLTGAGQLSQGDFNLGVSIYPFSNISNTPAQPYIYAQGKVGFGTFEDKTRTDSGYGMGAGVDLAFFKSSGLTIEVEQHSATESATRLWVGYYWR